MKTIISVVYSQDWLWNKNTDLQHFIIAYFVQEDVLERRHSFAETSIIIGILFHVSIYFERIRPRFYTTVQNIA